MSHARKHFILPRGIAPELLRSQVENTMPYLFGEGVEETPLGRFPPAKILREFKPGSEPLSHFEYFRLCLSAHHLTCATPVPTDVDNQIRRKLWPEGLPLEIALQMAELVLGSRFWGFTLVSSRVTYGPADSAFAKEAMSGHRGEWFTVATAAYCALKQYAAPLAQAKRQELLSNISDEVLRHSEFFGALWQAGEGLACLTAAAALAHNFGDLDRVMDMWALGMEDPLRSEYYKLASVPFDPQGKLRYLGRLWVAGELYKSTIDGGSMAFDNHRHFALRKPRCLRQHPSFLIPTGPFFDSWGRRVAKGLATSEGKPTEATLEVLEALSYGWERLPNTLGYGRALRGFLEVHPDLDLDPLKKIDSRRVVLETTQAHFEKRWHDEALRLMDEIPARAAR